MFKRDARGAPGGQPAIFRKKTYTLDRFGRDLGWLLGHLDDLLAVYLGGRIEPELREAIMVGVAYENACRWCGFMHSEWARETGLSDEDLREATELEPPAMAPSKRAAVVYARRRAAQDFADPDSLDARDTQLGDHFDARIRDLIEAVARLMNTANLMANSFDALLSRLRGQPAPHSRLGDELVFGALFALGVPMGGLGLAILRKKGPLRLAKEFITFSEAFDWRVEQRRLPSVANAGEGGRARA